VFKIDVFKRKAVVFHLLLSGLLTVGLATWILWRWFPAPFSFAAGALTGLMIVISVDMCLGPLLTFIVMHSKKSIRERFIDALVIALLQLSALSYGMWQVYLASPAAVVFWEDAFYLVKTGSLQQRYGEVPDLTAFSQQSVPVIYALKPVTSEDLRAFNQALHAGVVPFEQVSLYRPLAEGLPLIKQSPVNIQKLLQRFPQLQPQLDALGDQQAQQTFVYSALRSEYGKYLMVLDDSAQLRGVLQLPE